MSPTILLCLVTAAFGLVDAKKKKKPKVKSGFSSDDSSGESTPLSKGAKIAIIVVAALVFCVILFLVWKQTLKPWLAKRKSSNDSTQDEQGQHAEKVAPSEGDSVVHAGEKQKHDLEAGSTISDPPVRPSYSPPAGPPHNLGADEAPMAMPTAHLAPRAS